MTETLALLTLVSSYRQQFGADSAAILNDAPDSHLLFYTDFSALLPHRAESTWRVMLNRLVEDRLVVKRQTKQGVGFLLSHLGERLIAQEFLAQLILVPKSTYGLVLLKKKPNGPKNAASRARELLAKHGYIPFGVESFIREGQHYSDLLWKEIEQAGYFAAFTVVEKNMIKPVHFAEILSSFASEEFPQRKWFAFSKDLSQLLVRCQNEKELTAATKKQIGKLAVSGLALFSVWSPVFSPGKQERAAVLAEVEKLFSLLSIYCQKRM